MADYGGKGLLLTWHYIIGIIGSGIICALLELDGALAVWSFLILMVVIAQIVKRKFG